MGKDGFQQGLCHLLSKVSPFNIFRHSPTQFGQLNWRGNFKLVALITNSIYYGILVGYSFKIIHAVPSGFYF